MLGRNLRNTVHFEPNTDFYVQRCVLETNSRDPVEQAQGPLSAVPRTVGSWRDGGPGGVKGKVIRRVVVAKLLVPDSTAEAGC